MAAGLHPNPTRFLKPHHLNPILIPKTSTPPNISIRCGPRDNRGPLVKGRVLSIEAIQAVQALKRAQRSDPTNFPLAASKTLSRLIKSDLLATLKELLRQEQCVLALQVLSTVRSEYDPELSLIADVVLALSKSGMVEDIDRLIYDWERNEGEINCDDKGLIRLVKAVIGADRRESTVRIYQMMKRSGWGPDLFGPDEHMVRVLGKGLRRLGEVGLADEVESVLVSKGNLERLSV